MGCAADMGAAFGEWEAAAGKGSITAKARMAAWKASSELSTSEAAAEFQNNASSVNQRAELGGLWAWVVTCCPLHELLRLQHQYPPSVTGDI